MMMRDIGLSFTMKCEINLWKMKNYKSIFYTNIYNREIIEDIRKFHGNK